MSANTETKSTGEVPAVRLLTPLTIGEGTAHELKLENRVLMAPLTRGRASEDGVVNELHEEYYVQRASAGLIFTEATGISQRGLGWFKAPGIYNEKQTEAWKRVVEKIHGADGKVFLQLWHMGRQAHSDVTGQPIIAPSPIPMEGEITARNHEKKPAETPQEMTEEVIKETVEEYRQAAQNAKDAGFDGVEVHAANGYLINLFLDPNTNKRTDQYGGSLENRLRFLQEIVSAVLTVWPKERVSVRLSPNGAFGQMGHEESIETYTEAIDMLAKMEVGMIHLMDGLSFGFHEKTEPFTSKMAREVIVKAQGGVAKTALVSNVGYTKETGEQLLAEAGAEEVVVPSAVVYGRPFISTPDLPERFKNGWELNPDAEYADWWTKDGAEGLTTFPKYGQKGSPAADAEEQPAAAAAQ